MGATIGANAGESGQILNITVEAKFKAQILKRLSLRQCIIFPAGKCLPRHHTFIDWKTD